jgi:DNA-damage-inducible protein J
MATANITIRMDENLKKQAEALFDEMGMNITTAFTIFTKTAVRLGKIPFEIAVDPFYSKANQSHLNKVIDEIESGKANFIVKTMEELEAMENE